MNVMIEYCWAVTQDALWTCCGQSGSSVLEFGYKLSSHIYIYTHIHTHTHTQTSISSLFVHGSLCRYIEGGGKSKCCIIGDLCSQIFMSGFDYIHTHTHTHSHTHTHNHSLAHTHSHTHTHTHTLTHTHTHTHIYIYI